jgi:hypothetical protein
MNQEKMTMSTNDTQQFDDDDVSGELAGQSFNPAEFTDGASQLITFARVERTVFDSKSPGKPSEARRVAAFTNGKSLPLNKTNLKLLVKWFGPHPSAWIGRQVVIYRDESVSYAGQLVGGWRLRKPSKHDAVPSADGSDETVPF